MATKLTAIRKLRPELKRMRTMQMPALVRLIARSTGLNEGGIRHVTYELRDSIAITAQHGQAVKVEGLGTFAPVLRSDGSLAVSFRPDRTLLNQLNSEKFDAPVINRDNIGKSPAELVALWNKTHPEDPVAGG